jgi:hypothetical protein
VLQAQSIPDVFAKARATMVLTLIKITKAEIQEQVEKARARPWIGRENVKGANPRIRRGDNESGHERKRKQVYLEHRRGYLQVYKEFQRW